MARLKDIVEYCDERTKRKEVPDFDGAHNGLQFENHGEVTRIGAAVDANLPTFELAARAGVNFLIAHHGMFWNPPVPLTGPNRRKLLTLMAGDIAVYGAHLPLDCHPQIGNNAILARKLGLKTDRTFCPHQGVDIAVSAPAHGTRRELRERLQELFPGTLIAIEGGPDKPRRVGVLTGSGGSVMPLLKAEGIDTYITGEVKQEHFTVAMENEINLYLGGHYATEVFGVQALAEDVARKFDLEWEFLDTGCPL